jgi:hypothetical protein
LLIGSDDSKRYTEAMLLALPLDAVSATAGSHQPPIESGLFAPIG